MKHKLFRILLLLLASVFSPSVQGQDALDSLLHVIRTSDNDSLRACAMYDACIDLVYDNADSSRLLADQALALSVKANLIVPQAHAYMGIGYGLDSHGDYDSALYFYNKGLGLLNDADHPIEIADFQDCIAFSYQGKGDLATAMDWQFKALRIGEEQGDSNVIVNSWSSIGNLYYEIEDYEQARDYFKRCKDYTLRKGDSAQLAADYLNYGNALWSLGRTHEGYFYLNSAGELYERLGHIDGASVLYSNLGAMRSEEGDHREAIELTNHAIELAKLIDYKAVLITCYNNLGNSLHAIRRYDEALVAVSKALELADEMGAKDELMNTYFNLAVIYEAKRDFEKALQYYELGLDFQDSVYAADNQNQMAELAERYESEKKERELAILEKDQRLMSIKQLEAAAAQQRLEAEDWVNEIRTRIAYGVFIFAVLAVFVIGLILVRSSRANRALKMQKEEIAAKGVELQTAHQSIKSQREEIRTQEENLKDANHSILLQKDEIEEKNAEVMSSIRYAQRIQSSILPSDRAVRRQLTASFILFQPKEYVSGDFYWMEPVGDKILFAAVDCTGHGIPGAFVSMVGNTGLDRAVKEFGLTQPAAIMDKLAEFLDDIFVQKQMDAAEGVQIKDGMDMTLCALDRKTNLLEYAGAKNPLYLVRRANDPIVGMEPKASSDTHSLYQFSVDKQPVGSFPERKPFTNHQLQLHTGDTLYLFSDGYADQFGGPKGKKLKYSALRNLLLEIQGQTMQEQKARLGEAFNAWKDDMEQVDDVIVFGVRI